MPMNAKNPGAAKSTRCNARLAMVTLAVLAEGGLAESHIRKLREELTLKSFLVKATTCNRRRLNDAQSTTHDLTRRAT
jgi:hypothetical protein